MSAVSWDIANVAYDAWNAGYAYAVGDQDLQRQSLTDLAVDSFAAAIPGLHAGTSKVVRAWDGIRGTALRAQGYQRHHIIPQSFRENDLLKKLEYDLDSKQNSIALPGKLDVGSKRAIHSGMHTRSYTEKWRSMLAEIDAGFRSGRISAEQARELIDKEVSRTRKSLRDGEMSLNNSSIKN